METEKARHIFSKVSAICRTTSPTEHCKQVRIMVGQGKIAFAASDVTNYIIGTIDCEAIENGRCSIYPDRMSMILAEANCDSIELELLETKLAVTAGRAKYTLPVGNPNKKPAPPDVPSELRKMPAESLRMLFHVCRPAIDKHNHRYAFASVALLMREGRFIGFGCDGKRIAIAAADNAGWKLLNPTKAVFVPGESVPQIIDALRTDGDATCGYASNHFYVGTDTIKLWSRTADGVYPNVETVLQEIPPVHFHAKAGDISTAVRLAVLGSTDESDKSVMLSVDDNAVSIFAGDEVAPGELFSTSTIEAQVEELAGGAQVCLSAKRVLDFTSAFPADAEIHVNLRDTITPLLFRAGGEYAYVLMPMSRD